MFHPDHPVVPSVTEFLVPRAGLDPIDSAAVAEDLVRQLIARPLRYETIVVVLDRARCGRLVLSIDGTAEPDAVLDVADLVVEMALGAPVVGGVLLVSVRPPCTDAVDHLDDVDRWLELDEGFALTGLELIEWFVVDRGLHTPRALIGEPDRWGR